MSYNFIVLLLIRTTKFCGEYVSLFTHSHMTNQSVNRLMLIAWNYCFFFFITAIIKLINFKQDKSFKNDSQSSVKQLTVLNIHCFIESDSEAI